ncbi:MAG TPA: DUF4384 domain-containing protein [Candidatus Bathyarchaeia archaeon]|nr:DUF4384 domain-containing protein [Candidatus Bathyarchaeia archaeon]
MSQFFRQASTLTLLLISASATLAETQTNPQDQEESSRQIVLDRFNKARPAADVTAGVGGSRVGANRTSVKPPVYRRTGPVRVAGGRKPSTAASEEIGVTVWRLRPSRSGDTGARVLVLDGLKQAEWTPERIEADTPLNIGDRVRLTIESPRPGFLYIIDREQYADGSFGEPMMIFPTLRTRGGDNLVAPGRLIDIPAQEDQYSYFTAQPTGNRRDQVAEVLTIILVSQPLPVQISEQPLKITNTQVAGWEKTWGGTAERLELIDGAGRTWTKEEKLAGAANSRQLTQTGPPPQTVYRVARKAGGPLLVTVPLMYQR